MFKQVEIAEGDTLAKMVERIFSVKLAIEGGWGYEKEDATTIIETPLRIKQFEHNLAHMRSYIEMSLMQDQASNYKGINLIEKAREKISGFEKVTYEVSAMLESDYNKFIKSYKEGYEKDGFDIDAHFRERKQSTLIREVNYWYEV